MTALKLEVIVASVRIGRVGDTAARWFAGLAAAESNFGVSTLDLMEFDLPQDFSASADVDEFTRRVAEADAFVVVTPEYNHGYPAALKTALDSVKHEWRGKPIAFVSYGGKAGGVRATEQLRQVVAELHMVSVREAVSLHGIKHFFDAQGATDDAPALDSAHRVLVQLHWWADALATARSAEPYPR